MFAAGTLLVGCGGSGGGGGSTASPFAGSYSGTFVRGTNSRLLLSVASNGSVDILIDDAAGSSNPWTGTGTVMADGTFTGTASQSRAPINLNGSFSGTGSSATFTGSMSGGATATGVTATPFVNYSNVTGTYSFVATGGPNSSVGNTTGTITFTSGGIWTLTGTNSFGDQWTTGGSMTPLGAATSSGNYVFGQNQGAMKVSCPGSFTFNAGRTGGTASIQVVPQPTGGGTTFTMTLTRTGM